RCTVSGTIHGIFAGSPGSLFVADTTLRATNDALTALISSGSLSVSVDRCVFVGNNSSISIFDFVKATVRGSVVTGNLGGISLQATAGGTSELNVTDCLVTDNTGIGVSSSSSSAGGVATLRISDSTVTNNQIGLFQLEQDGTAILLSRGNNTVE